MFGFGRFGRGKGRWGAPGWLRQAPWWGWSEAAPESAWHWGAGPGWRWQWEAQQLPPAERREYLEAFKAHLEARLKEVNQALEEVNQALSELDKEEK